MKLETMLRKLREAEVWTHWREDRAMYENIEGEDYQRQRAEDAYVHWLNTNDPYALMYRYPNNPNDYEKFMWVEGYLANRRGYRR